MAVGQVLLPDLLVRLPAIRWFIARVSSVQTAEHSLTLDYRGTLVPHTAYLESYPPVVGDVVHVITDQHNGMLVVGKEVLRPAPTPPGPPTVTTVTPSGAASWLAGVGWTAGTPVRQGDGWSGAWFYPSAAFIGMVGHVQGSLEIKVSVPVDTGPLSFVLHGNADTSTPFARDSSPFLWNAPEGPDQWIALPLGWTTALISGESLGIGLSTDQVSYTAAITSGGTLRFTAL